MKSCPIRWGSVIESRTWTGHAAVVGEGVDEMGVAAGEVSGVAGADGGACEDGADGPADDVAAEMGDAEADDAEAPGGETAGALGGAPRQPPQVSVTRTTSIRACRPVCLP